MTTTNDLSQTLKALHARPKAITFTNIWDLASLQAVLSLNTPTSRPVEAIATASWAFAATLGIKDEELTLEQNLSAIGQIAPVVRKAGLPLSVDLQDGYGDQIEDVVRRAVEMGANGANIEDSIPAEEFENGIDGSLYGMDEQVSRLQRALKAASDAGCPDFVLNARCDVFVLSTSGKLDDEARMNEAIKRGKAYIDAGATTVFFWGGPRGLRDAEVVKLVREVKQVAVKLSDGEDALSPARLSDLGVQRISIGPSLFKIAVETVRKTALNILDGGNNLNASIAH